MLLLPWHINFLEHAYHQAEKKERGGNQGRRGKATTTNSPPTFVKLQNEPHEEKNAKTNKKKSYWHFFRFLETAMLVPSSFIDVLVVVVVGVVSRRERGKNITSKKRIVDSNEAYIVVDAFS